MSAEVELFTTSILGNPVTRSRHDRYISVLSAHRIPFVYHDLASDDEAKRRWRRKARDPRIPGLLVRNEWVGTFEEFEEAVEFGELRQFLGYDAPAQPQRTVPAQPPPSTSRLPPAPTLMATPAAPGQGARPDGGADEMLAQLLPQGAEITDADVDALLKELEKPLKRTPRRTYTPSSRAAPPPMPMPPSHGTPAPDRARYDPGSRNLVEEAARAIGVEPKPRPPVPRMTLNRRPLQEVLEERRSRQAKTEQQRRNDELFASLGLSDVQINDADADEFLNKGTIPQLQHSGRAPEQEAMAAPTSTGAAPETLAVAEPVAETERANEAGAASEAGAGNEGPVEGASTVSLATSEDKESPKDAADVSGAKVGDKNATDSEEPREQELGDEPSASKTLEQPLDDKLADSETGLNDKLAVQDPTATKSLDESAQLLAETSPEVPVTDKALDDPLAGKAPMGKALDEPLADKDALDKTAKEPLADEHLKEPLTEEAVEKTPDEPLANKALDDSTEKPLDESPADKSLKQPAAATSLAKSLDESLTDKPREKPLEESLADKVAATDETPSSGALEKTLGESLAENEPLDKSLEEPLADKSISSEKALDEPLAKEPLSKSLEEPLDDKALESESILEEPLADKSLSKSLEEPLSNKPRDESPKERLADKPLDEPFDKTFASKPLDKSLKDLLEDKPLESSSKQPLDDKLLEKSLNEPLAGSESAADKGPVDVLASKESLNNKPLKKSMEEPLAADNDALEQPPASKSLEEPHAVDKDTLEQSSMDKSLPQPLDEPLANKSLEQSFATEPLEPRKDESLSKSLEEPLGESFGNDSLLEQPLSDKEALGTGLSAEKDAPLESSKDTAPFTVNEPVQEPRVAQDIPEEPMAAKESPEMLLADKETLAANEATEARASKDELAPQTSGLEEPLAGNEADAAKDSPLTEPVAAKDVPRDEKDLDKPKGSTMSADDQEALAYQQAVAKALAEMQSAGNEDLGAKAAAGQARELPLPPTDKGSLDDTKPLASNAPLSDKGAFDNAAPLSDKNEFTEPIAATQPVGNINDGKPLASEDATAQVPKDTLDEKHGVQDSQLDRTREAPLDMDEKHNAAAMPKQTLFDGAKDPQDIFSDEARVPLADRPALENPLDDLPVTKEALSNEPAADVPVQTQWPETPKDVPSMGAPSEATMPLADTARASEAWNEAPASGAEQFQATPLMATASATDSTERDAPTNTPGMLESSEASGTVEPAVDASVPAVEPQPAAAQPHVPPMSDATHARAHWDSAADMDKAVLGAAPGADVSEDETPVAAKVIGPPSSHAAEDLLHSLERPRARDVRHMSSGATAEEERVAVHQTLDRFSALEPPLAASEVTETHDEHSDAPRSHARDARPMSAGATAEEERVAVHQMLDRFSALEPPLSSNEVAEGHDEHLGTPSSPAAQDTRHMSAGATAEEERVAVHQTLDRFSALEPPLAASEVDLPRDEHSGELPLPDLNDVSSESQRIAEHQVIDRFSALNPPLRVSSERLGGAERNAARIASERGALHTKTLPHAPRDPTESHDTPKAPATSTLPSASVLPHDESSGDDEPDDGVPDLWVSGVPGTSQAFAQSHVAGHRSGTDWDWDAPTSETSGSLHDVPHPESTSHAPTYGISHSDPASLPGDDTVSEYSEDAAHMTAISERDSVAPSDSDATLRKVDAPSSVEATPRVETEPAPTPSLAEERAQTPVAVPVPKGPSDAQPEASEDGLARTPPSASHKTFADDAAPKGLLSTPRGTRSPGRAGTSPSLRASRPPPTPEQAVPRFLLDTKAKEPPSEPVQAPAGTLGESPMQDDWNMLQASKEQGERTLPHEPSELPAQTERALPRVPVESEQSAFAPAAIPADTRLPKSRESLLEKAAKGSPVQEPPAAEPQVPNAPAEPSVSSAAELGMGLASSPSADAAPQASADAAPQASSTVGLGSHVPGTEDAASATAAPLPSTGPHSQDPSAGPEAQARNVPEPKPRSRSSLLEMAVLRARESMAGMSTSRSGETRDAARHDSAAMAPSKSNEPVRDAAEPSSPAAVSEPRMPESPSAAPAAAATSTRPTGRPSLRERLARLSSSDRTKEHAEAGESAADSATSPRASAGAPRGELPPAPGGPRAFPSAAEGDESEQSFADQSVVDRWADRSFDAAAPTEASKDEARFDNGAANVLDASVLPSDKSSEKGLDIGLDKGGAQSLFDSAPSNTSLDKSFDKPLDKSFGRPLDTPLDQPTLGSTGPTGPTTQDPSPSAPVPAPSAASAPPRRAVSGAPPRRAIPDVRSLSAAQPRRTHRKTLSEVMREADEFLQEWK
ncbi:uncharacterized protein MJAP1_001562 [Malassezia japonica]|uniref:SH3 domain-containing protein n=1 Tax=Malassezia japonica TaxID=223818 RepID=A0AAF0F5A2_9BASI|nr:uncharacterized protein MJAP1_001562 [Malassezia japonica]WFD38603.1 hypothetical protein MJAP1_001562 [Malassezia japonica]